VADWLLSLFAVITIGVVFILAAGSLLLFVPLGRIASWLDEHDRQLTSAAVAVLALLAGLVLAGQAAIHI
jgi:hypothetical protein